jgi:hypothetical protein
MIKSSLLKETVEGEQLIEEIRVNPEYANLVFSEYEDDKGKGDSNPKIKKKTIFTKDYISKLNESRRVLTGSVMPPNCRFIEPLSRGFLVVVEEPPAFRTVFIDKGLKREFEQLRDAGKLDDYEIPPDFLQSTHIPYHLNLAIPYSIFIMWVTEYYSIGQTEIYFRTSQLKGLSDNLLRAPFLNIPDGQTVCYNPPGKQHSLTAAIQGAVKAFWESVFNRDFNYNYVSYRKAPILGNYLEWEAMSRINPMFIYTAEWLDMDYNLGSRINFMIKNVGGRARQEVGYHDLRDLFYSRRDSGVEVKPSPRSSRSYRLFYDIANGVYLDRLIQIETGDSFKTHDGKTAYIDSFAGFSDGSDIKFIQLDINGNKHLMKFNRNCRTFLLDKIKEERFADEFVLSSGEKVKPEDIIIVKTKSGNQLYRKIEYIRRSRGIEGQDDYEIKIGPNFYLASRLEAEKFNIETPVYKGVELKKGEDYVIIPGRQKGVFVQAHRCKYVRLDVSGNTPVALFTNKSPDLDGMNQTLNFSEASPKQSAYPIDSVTEISSGVTKIGRSIFTITRNGRSPYNKGFWKLGPCLGYESSYSINQLPPHRYVKNLYNDDTFHIDGVDFDIDFKIGDKVVVANWEDPLSVLSVKTIRGFKQEGDTLDFILEDKNGNLSTQQYINQNSLIHVGKIRKVTNKWDRLSVGTKIIANEAGIPNFPKKDVNIIVAFVIDTGTEPLVLCSNGCTLWYSDVVEKFTKVKMKSKRWEQLQHVPLDLSKIKFQAGDVVNGLSDFKEPSGFLLYDPAPTRSLKAIALDQMIHGNDIYSYTMDKYFINDIIFDGIPSPRVASTKVEEGDIVRGYLNIHSYQVEEDPSSVFTFLRPKER